MGWVTAQDSDIISSKLANGNALSGSVAKANSFLLHNGGGICVAGLIAFKDESIPKYKTKHHDNANGRSMEENPPIYSR